MANTRIVGTRSAETLLIINRLRKAKDVGDVVTYEELNTIVGRNVQHEARCRLHSARNIILDEDEAWFAVVEGVGVRRCSSEEANAVGANYRRKIRSVARRGAKILAKGVNYDELDDEQKIQFNTHLSLYGVINQFTNTKSLARIEEKVRADPGNLSIGTTLDALRDIG